VCRHQTKRKKLLSGSMGWKVYSPIKIPINMNILKMIITTDWFMLCTTSLILISHFFPDEIKRWKELNLPCFPNFLCNFSNEGKEKKLRIDKPVKGLISWYMMQNEQLQPII
jgi:hypothetical protein